MQKLLHTATYNTNTKCTTFQAWIILPSFNESCNLFPSNSVSLSLDFFKSLTYALLRCGGMLLFKLEACFCNSSFHSIFEFKVSPQQIKNMQKVKSYTKKYFSFSAVLFSLSRFSLVLSLFLFGQEVQAISFYTSHKN